MANTLRVVLCLIIVLLVALVIAQFAFIIARENHLDVPKSLVWGGGSFMAMATFVAMIMNFVGAFM